MTSKAATTLSRARAQNGLPDHFGVRIFPNDKTGDTDSGSNYRFGFVEGPGLLAVLREVVLDADLVVVVLPTPQRHGDQPVHC